MENSSQILKNLKNDVDETCTSPSNPVAEENDTDLIRRRRLEHLANRGTAASADNQDEKNDNA